MATITIEEYRKILNDHVSSEEQIKKRIQYLESFCRNIIKLELENHIRDQRTNKQSANKV